MIRIRPSYYEQFSCIAGACTFTCCQEWKINVDPETLKRWKTLTPRLSDFVIRKDGTQVIRLNKDHRCPFLSDEKLCRLVTAYGDSVLSETCQIFPREVHAFSRHEEETLMPCCPAVVDLLFEAASLPTPASGRTPVEASLYSTSESGVPSDIFLFPSPSPELLSEEERPLFLIRESLIQLILDSKKAPEESLLEGFYILLELSRSENLTEAMIRDCFSDKTKTALAHAIGDIPLPAADTLAECNELFQDLSVNYRNEGLYGPHLDPVFPLAEEISRLFSEEPVSSCLSGPSDLYHKWDCFNAEFSRFSPLFRVLLAEECYSDLILPDSDLESMVIQFQWITLSYTAIRHLLFLTWLKQTASVSGHSASAEGAASCDGTPASGEPAPTSEPNAVLSYETVRNAIVVIFRMTGYETDDILDYLENSFEELIWEWGYLAMIVGRP